MPHSPAIDLETIVEPATAVEGYLRTYLAGRCLPVNLQEAIEYALLGGGKMLRPVLVLRCCEAVGGAFEDAMAPAAAIEMIHTFSLVHDDLPAMDDDDLRRGRATLHKHTNEAMAVLAGDAMMGLAYELITTRIVPPSLAIRILTELTTATNNMIGGQVYDTLGDCDEATLPGAVGAMQRLKRIHLNKTGALLRASCRMGAICGQADKPQLAAVTRYAEAIGLMFQVVDDLLDVTQTTERLGKTAGKDVEQDKLTYPALLGLEGTRAEVARLHQEAGKALEPLGEQAVTLRLLADYMAVREK